MDDNPVVPDRPTPSISVDDALEHDVQSSKRCHDPVPGGKGLVWFAPEIKI
jgi:hypothetical protein